MTDDMEQTADERELIALAMDLTPKERQAAVWYQDKVEHKEREAKERKTAKRQHVYNIQQKVLLDTVQTKLGGCPACGGTICRRTSNADVRTSGWDLEGTPYWEFTCQRCGRSLLVECDPFPPHFY